MLVTSLVFSSHCIWCSIGEMPYFQQRRNCPVYVIGKYEGNDCWEGTISVRIERKRNNEDAKDI